MENILKQKITKLVKEYIDCSEADDVKYIQQEFNEWLGGRSNIFQFPNGSYVYVEYDPDRNVFVAGDATNNGMIEKISIPYMGTVQETIEELYNDIIEKYPELLNDSSDNITESIEYRYIVKEIKKILKENNKNI